jgi:hypothetical protein
MNAKVFITLKNYIKSSSDFLDVYKVALEKQLDVTKPLLCDILFNHFSRKDDKQLKKAFHDFVDTFINKIYFESTLNFYILDKKYIDIAWLQIDDDIINIDDIYHDFKVDCNY